MNIWRHTSTPGIPMVYIDLQQGDYTRTEVLEIIALLATELDAAANKSKELERERDDKRCYGD